MLWSNHFDQGYTMNANGSCAGAVINEYFTQHFDKAIETARQAAAAKDPFVYRWTTQSWLVNAYRHCNATPVNIDGPGAPSSLKCPTAAQLARFESAVRNGTITWHAFPFNAELELFDATMADAALNLTFAEDRHFGHPPRRTLSLRDVPGLTRAALPRLAARGVRAVSVGENTQCAPVAVPPIFVWRDAATGAEVLAMYHGGGYGRRRLHGRGGEAGGGGGAAGAAGPAGKLGNVVVSRGDCVEMPVAGVALCFAWRLDNTGPHDLQEVHRLRAAARRLFPGAAVVSSDGFDDFVDAVWPARGALPVVEAEIGDSWVFGADADPLKVALFRAAQREYGRCMARGGDAACAGAGGGAAAVTALRSFERLMMTAGEHTWGWNGGAVRRKSWSNSALQKSLATDAVFQSAVRTWQEQRAFLRHAVAALPAGAPLRAALVAAFDEVEGAGARAPWAGAAGDGWRDVELRNASAARPVALTGGACGAPGGQGQGQALLLGFGADGALTRLRDAARGAEWASPRRPLAALRYQALDNAYITAF
eukprot:g4061.t1